MSFKFQWGKSDQDFGELKPGLFYRIQLLLLSGLVNFPTLSIIHVSWLKPKSFLESLPPSLNAQASPTEQSAPTTSPGQNSNIPVLIAEVVIVGINDAELEEQISNVISTQPGKTTTRSQLQQDINTIFSIGLFRNVRAVPSDTEQGVRVTFEVELNPILKDIKLESTSIIDVGTLQKIFSEQLNRTIDFNQIQAGVQEINEWYKQNGYILAQARFDSSQVSSEGIVTLSLSEGIIEEIRVQFTDENTDESQEKSLPLKEVSEVANQIQLKPGDLVNQQAIQQDLQRINQLPGLLGERATFTPGQKNARHAIVTLQVRRSEQSVESVNQLVSQAEQLEQQRGDADQSQAIAKYEQALAIYEQQQDRTQQAFILRKLGDLKSKEVQSLIEDIQKFAKNKLVIDSVLKQKDDVLNLDYSNQSDILNSSKKEDVLGLFTLIEFPQDPQEVAILNKRENQVKNQQQALDYYHRAIDLFKKDNNQWGEILELYHIGRNYRFWNQPEQALVYFKQVLPKLKAVKVPQTKWLRIATLNEMALAHQELDETQIALEQFLQLSLEFRELSQELSIIKVAPPPGGFQYRFGIQTNPKKKQKNLWYEFNFDFLSNSELGAGMGPELLETSSEDWEKNQRWINPLVSSVTLLKIGQVYRTLGEEQQQIRFLQQSLEQINQQLQLSNSSNQLLETGVFFVLASFAALELEDSKQARQYFQELVSFSQNAGYPEWGASLLVALAIYQEKFAKVDGEADIYLQEAALLIPQITSPEWKAGILIASAWLHHELGNQSQAVEQLQTATVLEYQLNTPEKIATFLLGLSWVYQDLGEQQKASTTLQRAITKIEQVQQPKFSAPLLLGAALTQNKFGDRRQAITSFNQAIAKIETVEKKEFSIPLLLGSAWIAQELGQPQKIIPLVDKAKEKAKEIDQKLISESLALSWAFIYEELKQEQKADKTLLDFFRSLKQQKNISNLQLMVKFLPILPILIKERYPRLVTPTYQEIAGIYQEKLQDPLTSAQILAELANIDRSSGQPQAAIRQYQELVITYQELGKWRQAAEMSLEQGRTHQEIGEYQQAINTFEQAVQLLQNSQTPGEAALVLRAIASFYQGLGDPQQAKRYYKRAKELAEQLDDKGRKIELLVNIGEFYRENRQYEDALAIYQEALVEINQLSQSNDQAWQNQQEQLRSLLSPEKWTHFQKNLDNPLTKAVVQAKISLVYSDLGQKEEAIAAFRQAVELAKDSPYPVRQQMFLQGAILYEALDEPEQALFFLKKAQANSDSITSLEESQDQSALLIFLGKLSANVGKVEAALDYYNQALQQAKETSNPSIEADSRYKIAQVERDRGNLTNALNQVETALEIVEGLRTQIGSPELRTSYFATVQDYYEFYIDLLMQLHQNNPEAGYDALAFQASERGRARTLLELLTEANAQIHQGADPQLLQQEQQLQDQFQTLEERRLELLSNPVDSQQLQSIQERQAELLQQYQELRAKIRSNNSRYANLSQPQPLTVQQVQQQILDGDTLLLQYALGKERSYLWAITPTEIKSYELPGRAEIESKVRAFAIALTRKEMTNRTTVTANQLSEILLKPVTDQLEQKRLLIVPDGILHYVPFAALSTPKRQTQPGNYEPLLLNHEIVNLPSISTVAVIRQETENRQPAPKTIAILADPVFSPDDERVKSSSPSNQPEETSENLVSMTRSARDLGIDWQRLPGTRREAEAIIALVSPSERTQAFGFQANREKAMDSDLANYQIIHWATHGFANSRHPALSGIVMSLVDQQGNWQNGYLRLQDIYNLNLPSQLVVLSACQTAIGRNVRGEGLIGLTRGFMYAGASQVLASLWYVDDAATAQLMSIFYQQMLSEGLSPQKALRKAQLEMLQTQQWRSPYYWAAFTLQGDWLTD